MEKEKKYFVYLNSHNWTSAITLELVDKEDMKRLTSNYLLGKEKLVINGEQQSTDDLVSFRVFESIMTENDEIKFLEYLASHNWYTGLEPHLEPSTLKRFPDQIKEITKELIGNKQYGEEKRSEPKNPKDSFIDTSRIEDLRRAKIPDFDLSRLIKLCAEINSSYANGNYFAVGMLCRAVKDHIPPLFASGGQVTFQDVIDAKGLEKSDREALKILAQNKHIQDGFIHSQIKRRESLANSSTVEIRSQIDVLLRLIVEKGE